MQRIKWLTIFFIALHILSLCARAQSKTPVYYHWAGPTKVLLWRSLRESDQVTANLTANGVWEVIPAKSQGEPKWLDILKGFGTTKPGMPPAKIWNNFLTALHDGEIDSNFVKLRQPDLQLYLRVESSQLVRITFVKQKVTSTATFNRVNDQWQNKDNTTFALNPDELKAILEIENSSSTDNSTLAWGKWIEKYLKNPNSTDSKMYSENNEVHWLWQERLSENIWGMRSNTSQPTGTFTEGDKPKPESTPIQENPEDKNKTGIINWLLTQPTWVYVPITLALAAIFYAFATFLRKWQPKYSDWGRQKNTAPPTDGETISEQLDNAFKSVLENCSKQLNAYHDEFLEFQKKMMTEAFPSIVKDSKLAGLSHQEADKLIELGESTTSFYKTMLEFSRSHSLNSNLYPKNPVDKKGWLESLPQNIHKILVEKETLAAKVKEHESELKNQASIRTRGQEELEREKKRLEDKLTNTEKERDDNFSKYQGSHKKVGELNAQLQEKEKEIERISKESQYFESTLNRVNNTLISSLQQGIRFYKGKWDAQNNSTPFIIVTNLINYSLFHLFFAAINRNENMQFAMLMNLHRIADKLKETPGFTNAITEFQRQFPDITTREINCQQSKGDDKEGDIFSYMIRYLRDYAYLDITPFFYTDRPNGNVHRIG